MACVRSGSDGSDQAEGMVCQPRLASLAIFARSGSSLPRTEASRPATRRPPDLRRAVGLPHGAVTLSHVKDRYNHGT